MHRCDESPSRRAQFERCENQEHLGVVPLRTKTSCQNREPITQGRIETTPAAKLRQRLWQAVRGRSFDPPDGSVGANLSQADTATLPVGVQRNFSPSNFLAGSVPGVGDLGEHPAPLDQAVHELVSGRSDLGLQRSLGSPALLAVQLPPEEDAHPETSEANQEGKVHSPQTEPLGEAGCEVISGCRNLTKVMHVLSGVPGADAFLGLVQPGTYIEVFGHPIGDHEDRQTGRRSPGITKGEIGQCRRIPHCVRTHLRG